MTAHQEAGTATLSERMRETGETVAPVSYMCSTAFSMFADEVANLERALTAAREALEAKTVLLDAIQRGDSTLLTGMTNGPGSAQLDIQSPLAAIMADSLAKMIGDHNYIEMRMASRSTGENYIISCQREFRPTPHEKRIAAEQRAATAEAALAGVREDAEQANAAARRWYEAASPYATPEALAEAIKARMAQIASEERERCAKLLDEASDGARWNFSASAYANLARQIRALPPSSGSPAEGA